VKALLQLPANLLRDGEGWATETITKLGTHDSTHVDAPWHYNSTIDGKRAQTIDELPLEWFFGDGVKLDMTWKGEGDAVTVEDIEKELERIGYKIKPMDIVLIQTGRDIFYNDPGYIFKGCGVTASSTKWLYEKGIRVMGIDGWGWDSPLNMQAQEAIDKQEEGIFWAAHQVNIPYCHIERLVNLGAAPAVRFQDSLFSSEDQGGEVRGLPGLWQSWRNKLHLPQVREKGSEGVRSPFDLSSWSSLLSHIACANPDSFETAFP